MGTRILMVHGHLVRSQRHNSRCFSYLLRFFSNQKRDSDTTANSCQNPSSKVENTDSSLDSKWLNIKAGIFGPIDNRLRLPGDIGFHHDFVVKANIKRKPTLMQRRENIIDSIMSVPGEGLLDSVSEKDYKMKSGLFNLELQSVRKLISSFENYDKHYDVELTAFRCPNLLKKDFQLLFPNHDVESKRLTVLLMCQKTKYDMSGWSEDIEEEREFVNRRFIECAEIMCKSLRDYGFWADYIDPSSGRPALGPYTNSTFFETDERYRYLGLHIEDLGCCKVLSHPEWGTNIFAGTIFTDAEDEIAETISKTLLFPGKLQISLK
ncbi:Methylmalonic aciduria and homocystinuria type D protein, mitochondrial [Armadillidium nasatum]|uniref:Methylmalonic aciduria and homocystinuria type D protein, mitochondrial n=1 Tax=Armadillidium nasatum TaxID=96803 RepID=A0A5N5TGP9_9CRUS|nr:Methylmalonic aciduria and homocystinuria type D protein, mitochondrial [Armadillidium nasatum]